MFQRVQGRQEDEQHSIQQLDGPNERQCDQLRPGQRHDSPEELSQQQHDQLEHCQDDRHPGQRRRRPEIQVEPEGNRGAATQRQRVHKQDGGQAAARLVEQPHERIGSRGALLQHVPQARAIDVHQRHLSGRSQEQEHR